MRKLINIIEGLYTPPEYDADDAEHYDSLDKTGFFGAQAAGCLPMAKTTGRIMVVKRSAAVEQPGDWGNLGGAYHASERPMDAARRELHEETGYGGSAQMIPLMVFKKGTFQYSNFLAIIDDEFVPDLGWEATDYRWVDIGNWPQPLHFGLVSLFNDSTSVEIIKHYSEMFKASK